MPYSPASATEYTKKANTPAKRKKWAKVANAALKIYGEKGAGKAIATANAAVSDEYWQDGSFDGGLWRRNHSEQQTDQVASGDYRFPFTDAAYDRGFSAEQRKVASEKGQAMKGGGYPIKTKGDLRDAIQAVGRAKNRTATIKHIKKRASALRATELLPKKWGDEEPVPIATILPVRVRLGQVDAPEKPVSEKPILDHQEVNGTLRLYDSVELDDAAKVKFIDGGYMTAFPRIARTGIQTYKGTECGKQDMETVRVYRPEDEVFADKARHTYTHLPVTVGHPKEMVDAKNWKKYAVGHTGDEVLRDGQSVRVPMMLRDHDAIEQYKQGRKQLSVGYDCDLDWTAGKTEDGEEYDAVQHNIRCNHLAVVAAARGGPELTIGDSSSFLKTLYNVDGSVLFEDLGYEAAV